jgi:hypothetical protein
VVAETAMRGQLLVPSEKRAALQAELAEARLAVSRERDILEAARSDMARTTGRPLLPPPLPERPRAGSTRAEREAIEKDQFNKHMEDQREVTDQLRAYAEERNIAGLLDERRRKSAENLAQRRSKFKSGGSKSGGSRDRAKDRTPPPGRELTPPRPPPPPRDRTRTPPRAVTPPPRGPAASVAGSVGTGTLPHHHAAACAATRATATTPARLHRNTVPASLAGAVRGSHLRVHSWPAILLQASV